VGEPPQAQDKGSRLQQGESAPITGKESPAEIREKCLCLQKKVDTPRKKEKPVKNKQKRGGVFSDWKKRKKSRHLPKGRSRAPEQKKREAGKG